MRCDDIRVFENVVPEISERWRTPVLIESPAPSEYILYTKHRVMNDNNFLFRIDSISERMLIDFIQCLSGVVRIGMHSAAVKYTIRQTLLSLEYSHRKTIQ